MPSLLLSANIEELIEGTGREISTHCLQRLGFFFIRDTNLARVKSIGAVVAPENQKQLA